MAEEITKTILAAEAALRTLHRAGMPVSSAIEALNRAAMPASDAIEALNRAAIPLATIDALNRASMLAPSTVRAITLADRDLHQQITDFVKRSDLLSSQFRASEFGALGGLPNLSIVQKAIGDFHARFELPDMSAIRELVEQFKTNSFANEALRFNQSIRDIEASMGAMRVAWLDSANVLQSMQGFAELQGIGRAVRQLPAFSEGLADQLRASLGDWRDTITWPENIFNDTLARTVFYADMGLNSRLTDFPGAAFHQSLKIAGLIEPRTPDRTYDDGSDTDDQDDGFERNNAAHDLLQRFEVQIRKFIAAKMESEFGVDWIKHRVPEKIREDWRQKKEKARKAGEQDLPLIAYADFADYVPVIIRNDNWDAIFKPHFQRAEFG